MPDAIHPHTNHARNEIVPLEILLALVTFAFVASVTPGPNNLMLMASGANFGIRRTMPHFFGIAFGFVIMVVLVGTGLVSIFDSYPASYDILRGISVVYLGYLAWKIATSSPGAQEARGKPLTALQAALFQWVNPKAWALGLTAVTVYSPSQSFVAVASIAVILGLVNMPSIFVWVVLGHKLQVLLASRRRLRLFNYTMAVLLLASIYPMVV